MQVLKGKYNEAKVFTDNIETECMDQIIELLNQEAFKNAKIRIMPDCNAGKGCVIGFTGDLGDKVIPYIVGVDIGCGMYCVELGSIDINLEKLDKVIHQHIPSGMNVHEHTMFSFEKLEALYCYDALEHVSRIEKSIGTLGGGNHFIEVNEDKQGNKYLVIHSGSRNLGKQVAEYYQNVAIDLLSGKEEFLKEKQNIIKTYKTLGRQKEIESAIKELCDKYRSSSLDIPKELCYLTGRDREHYLHDMVICQEYADFNRKVMADIILSKMEINPLNSFTTRHNYIDMNKNIIRKGAISAEKDEKVIIPLNMRDGSIIAIGKGNEDWNYSAPHGAGRILSRRAAKKQLSMDEFIKSMNGIYTTSLSESTLDESPMAYKPMQEIIAYIKDTVEIIDIIKPVYNFKAH